MFNKKKFSKKIIIAAIIFVILAMPQSFAISTNQILLKDVETTIKNTSFNEELLIEMFPEVNESKIYEYIKTIQDFGPHPTQSSTIEQVGNYIFNQFILYCSSRNFTLKNNSSSTFFSCSTYTS